MKYAAGAFADFVRIRVVIFISVLILTGIIFIAVGNDKKSNTAAKTIVIDEMVIITDGVDVGPELNKVVGKDMKELHVRILPSGKIVRVMNEEDSGEHTKAPYTTTKDIMTSGPYEGVQMSGSIIRKDNGKFKYTITLRKDDENNKTVHKKKGE